LKWNKPSTYAPLLHQSPRNFGQPISLWTLGLAAKVSYIEGVTPEQVSAETMRATLERMGLAGDGPNSRFASPVPIRDMLEKKRGTS